MFKKILFALACVGTLTACNDDYKDWASPQANPQPATVQFGNGSVSEVSVIDLNAIADGQDKVKVCNITAPSTSSETYAPEYTINLDGVTYPITANGEIAPSELNDVIVKAYGQRPVERTVAATVSMWVKNGVTAVKTATSAAFNIKAIPVAPVIYDHLYIIGAPSEWDPKCTALPFTHSAKDVYEDPEFTVMFPVENGETWFAVTDDYTVQTGDWSNVFGCKEGNGANLIGSKGDLTRRSNLSDDGSFKVVVDNDAKFIKMTVNMLDGTYLIEKINFQPYIYYVGTANGWNNSADGVSQKLALTDAATGTYSGYIYCKQEDYGNTYRFLKTYGDWGNTYGASAIDTYEGPMEAGSSDDNFNATAGTGLYKVEMSLVARKFTATKIDMVGLIGDFNGWGSDFEMTWDNDEFCYVANNPGITAAGWKFRFNGSWDINLGGDLDNLVPNGDNISVAGSVVKFYPCRTKSNNICATVE